MATLERKKAWSPGVTVALVAIESLQVTVSSISKVAMTRGMSQNVYLAYSSVMGLVLLLPSALIFYRKRGPPALTRCLICKLFLLGLISTFTGVFMNLGIKNGSPTLTSAMGDLIPALTFLLALASGIEKLNLRFQSSQAKIIGTLVSIAGALTLTLYKGRAITGVLSDNTSHDDFTQFLQSNWIIGGAFSAAGASCLAVLFVVQTWILKEYPAELMVTLVSCTFGAIFTLIFSLIVEKDPDVWTLRPDTELVAIGSAAFLSAIRNVVLAWACRKKGPLYVAMFSPLGMVIAVTLGVSFLGDTLYVGSIIGGLIIALGFYAVIWGQAEEQKMAKDYVKGNSCLEPSSTDNKVPLLEHKSMDV